tara:strand:+ start:313 stop:555 length:243 start_codon:yes stop_codon:yes gene_type:complete
MRARSEIHVEYEVYKAILKSRELGIVLEELRKHLTEPNHEKSQERFVNGTKKALGFIENLMVRKVHRLPKTHPEYSEKVE